MAAEIRPKRLYLFDIDGTLITSGGAGVILQVTRILA
jgi:phosphoglycolate phosphatase-like HAD superfamily hydrolase